LLILPPRLDHLIARFLSFHIVYQMLLTVFMKLLAPPIVEAFTDPLSQYCSATVSSPPRPSRTICIFSSPDYRLRPFRLILPTVLAAVVFVAIALTSKAIVTDAEILSYP
jgi:hypothetical protein